jgi:hypothetical protein
VLLVIFLQMLSILWLLVAVAAVLAQEVEVVQVDLELTCLDIH